MVSVPFTAAASARVPEMLSKLVPAAGADGLLGLQLIAEPSKPSIHALVVGSPSPDLISSLACGHASAECFRVSSPTDPILGPLLAPPAANPSELVANAVDVELAAELDRSAPPLQRTVVALKSHALPHAAAILAALPPAGLAVVGARLIHLASQLGSSAQLGLDTPLQLGRALVLLIEGYDACERVQALAGAVDPKLARTTDRGSWRATYGVDRALNVVSSPRHTKGAQRAECFFFGPRAAAAAGSSPRALPLAFTQPRSPLILATEATKGEALTQLLSFMQRAGLALHVGARVRLQELSALGVSPRTASLREAANSGRCLLFLLSRGGEPSDYAEVALRDAQHVANAFSLAGACAELHPCAPTAGRQLLRGMAGDAPLARRPDIDAASLTVDAYSYMKFAIKTGLV